MPVFTATGYRTVESRLAQGGARPLASGLLGRTPRFEGCSALSSMGDGPYRGVNSRRAMQRRGLG